MDKSIAGLLAIAGALAAPAAQAATAPPLSVGDAMQASSYADLLKPIPNALALLKASAAARAELPPGEPAAEGRAQEVQYWYYHHHHHHHHHHWYRRRWHHHHHHHHNS